MKNTLTQRWAKLYIFIILICTLFPLVWIFFLSITDSGRGIVLSDLAGVKLTLSNYVKLWHHDLFKTSFINSIITTSIGVLLSLSLSIPCAYYLVFQKSMKKNRGLLFDLWLLFTYMLPEFFFIIPMYIIYHKVGLYDTYVGLALLYQVHVLPFSIWMFKNFFQSEIPRAIIEAANIDGASHFVILTKICTPLTRSGLVAVSILNGIWIWNELAIALSLSFSRAQTVTVGITSFRGYASIDYGAMTAASVVAIIPMLISAIFIQKHIIRGLTAGAVK